jgi:hypothetical protein
MRESNMEKVVDIVTNVGLAFIVTVGCVLTLFLTIKMGQAFFADNEDSSKMVELVENEWNCIAFDTEEYRYTTNLIVGKTLIPQTHTGIRNICVKYEKIK